MGSKTPTDVLAGNSIAIMGTIRMPKPGTPVFAMPTKTPTSTAKVMNSMSIGLSEIKGDESTDVSPCSQREDINICSDQVYTDLLLEDLGILIDYQ